MLTEIYIEALLVDEQLADQVGRLGILFRLRHGIIFQAKEEHKPHLEKPLP